MADKRAYFKLDVGYLSNPKVALIAASNPRAILLHIASIGYAAQHLTNGVVPIQLLLRTTGASKRDVERLLAAGLWVERPGGAAEVHDYLEHQRSADDVKGATEKARKAAGARWSASGNAPSNASSMPNAMPREREKRESTSGGGGKPPSDQSETSQTLVAEWIERCTDRPPSRVVGQVSRELKVMLDEGIPYEAVRVGLAAWHRKKLNPSTLASVVHETRSTNGSAPDTSWQHREQPAPPPDVADDPERFEAWLAEQRRPVA